MDNALSFHRMPRRIQFWNRTFTLAAWGFGLAGFVLPLGIIGYLLANGFRVISWEFLTTETGGFPFGTDGGVWPAIQGSFALVGFALLISVPFAFLGAIYLAEYCTSPRVVNFIRFLTECIAAIPSVLYGVFGYALLVVRLQFRLSLLSGAVTMAILLFPYLLIGMQESFRRVDPMLREAALALGISRACYLLRLALPRCASGFVAITVLAAGQAFGTAAPVLMTASIVHAFGRITPREPIMTLPTHLYYLVSEAVSFDHAFATAFVLVVALLLTNFCAFLLKRRFIHS